MQNIRTDEFAVQLRPPLEISDDYETLAEGWLRVRKAVFARALRDAASKATNANGKRMRRKAHYWLKRGAGVQWARECGIAIQQVHIDAWIKSGCPIKRIR